MEYGLPYKKGSVSEIPTVVWTPYSVERGLAPLSFCLSLFSRSHVLRSIRTHSLIGGSLHIFLTTCRYRVCWKVLVAQKKCGWREEEKKEGDCGTSWLGESRQKKNVTGSVIKDLMSCTTEVQKRERKNKQTNTKKVTLARKWSHRGNWDRKPERKSLNLNLNLRARRRRGREERERERPAG